MMEPPESDCSFLFCQEDISACSLAKLYSMKQKRQLCDILIKVENHSFQAHRVILAAAIPYFQAVFQSIDYGSSLNEISVEGIDPNALELLINFVYTGKLKITNENMLKLLSASEYLGLDQVSVACYGFLSKWVRADNVMKIRHFAEDTGHLKLLEDTDRYIRGNFDSFLASPDFVNIPFSYLKELTGRDDLVVANEESVFEAAMKWVKSREGRRDMLPSLLDNVRMAFLSPDYLITRVACEELIRSHPHCRDLVENAKTYHLLPQKRLMFPSLTTRPRSYKNADCLANSNTGCMCLYAVCYVEHMGRIVKFYDSHTEKWLTLGNQKHHKKFERVVASEDKINIIEGNAFEIFCIKTQTWTCLVTSHCPSFSAGVVAHCNMIYCFGGDCNSSDNVFCFDPQQNEWLPLGTLPLNLAHPGVLSFREHIYVIGGHYESRVFDTVHLFSPYTGVWVKCSSMLFQRDGPQCATVNNKIYVCGGSNNLFIPLYNVEFYEPQIDQWCLIITENTPTGFFSLVSYNGKLFAVNEYGEQDSSHKVKVYNPEECEWKAGVPVPGHGPRDSYARAVVVHNT